MKSIRQSVLPLHASPNALPSSQPGAVLPKLCSVLIVLRNLQVILIVYLHRHSKLPTFTSISSIGPDRTVVYSNGTIKSRVKLALEWIIVRRDQPDEADGKVLEQLVSNYRIAWWGSTYVNGVTEFDSNMCGGLKVGEESVFANQGFEKLLSHI